MGREIMSLFAESGHELVYRSDESGSETLSAPQVVLDFSNPAAISRTIEVCGENKSALVLGTTGLDDTDVAAVRELSALVPVVHSSNFCAGINILSMILADYSNILADWGMEIGEMHHDKKKDAPSGTALMLMASSGRKCPAHSVRLGNLPGDHAVYFANGDELITFSHRIISRSVLSRGALTAANFAHGAPCGYYEFKDVLRASGNG
jgi:4-hydroxy-tetrahydrodipicolinate reductase